MKNGYVILLVWSLWASCKIVDDKVSPCFSCSVAGVDSCSMTDNYPSFVCDKRDTVETINFSRCGAGSLGAVRFNYSGNPEWDSAVVVVRIDSSAFHVFPVQLPGVSREDPAIQYKKDGYFELPLSGGVSFGQSCTVSFILRSGSSAVNVARSPLGPGFQNIFLQWTAKQPGSPQPEAKESTD